MDDPIPPDPLLTPWRLLSLAIALVYVLCTLIWADGETAAMLGLYYIIPLACIWFSDAMGSAPRLTSVYLDRESSPAIVQVMGWVLLVLPILLPAISYLFS